MEVHILVQAAEENLRPTVPESCPKLVKDLIKKCWDPNPKLRPDVHLVLKELEAIHSDYSNNPPKWESTRKITFNK
jgi:hypothetical protein